MKIVVCVKYVPDTTIKIKITPDEKGVELAEVSFIVNPYDEFAVEEALKIKEAQGGEVIVVGAGLRLWRQGEKRRAVIMGSCLFLFAVLIGVLSILTDLGMLSLPYLFTKRPHCGGSGTDEESRISGPGIHDPDLHRYNHRVFTDGLCHYFYRIVE